jgi:DMSO/TMAO reductase YedYZ molybdopterin-dependent catalytic subunit
MKSEDRYPKKSEHIRLDNYVRRDVIKAMLGFGAASLLPWGLWKWIKSSPYTNNTLTPLRKTLEFNAKLTSKLLSDSRLAPTFPLSEVPKIFRANGMEGLQSPIEEDYKIKIESGDTKLEITLDDLKKLPKHDIIYEFKCVEGWSQIQYWGGVRFVDVMNHYKIGQKDAENLFEYVGMETPDGKYYVGIDTPSAIHPQTILAYEMNGKPLTDIKHGSPLRLIIPVKYGIKNLKRIGIIKFSDTRPKDYWALFGYDYFAGL